MVANHHEDVVSGFVLDVFLFCEDVEFGDQVDHLECLNKLLFIEALKLRLDSREKLRRLLFEWHKPINLLQDAFYQFFFVDLQLGQLVVDKMPGLFLALAEKYSLVDEFFFFLQNL